MKILLNFYRLIHLLKLYYYISLNLFLKNLKLFYYHFKLLCVKLLRKYSQQYLLNLILFHSLLLMLIYQLNKEKFLIVY